MQNPVETHDLARHDTNSQEGDKPVWVNEASLIVDQSS